MLPFNQSELSHQKALSLFPGGVNSPVRSFQSLGGNPLHFASSKGAYLFDVDGRSYLDFCSSWGPLILGHQHPFVLECLQRQMNCGLTFGATSDVELQLGECVQEFMPQLELLRFVCSGTEATMSAVRLSRFLTGKRGLLKFSGCYHGHYEDFLVQSGSGVLTQGIDSLSSSSPTLVVPYNSQPPVLEQVLEEHGPSLAAVIVEPVAANMGLISPEKGFLETLRSCCDRFGILLIFDEVMTGFRVHPGGASVLFGVQADLWTLGKILGGGLPAAAYGGRREFMSQVAPSGDFYQAGTLAGSPLPMAAGLATLRVLKEEKGWDRLERLGVYLDSLFEKHLPDLAYHRVASFFSFFPGLKRIPSCFEDLSDLDRVKFQRIYWSLLNKGIYLSPSPYEVNFLSLAQSKEDLFFFVSSLKESCKEIKVN